MIDENIGLPPEVIYTARKILDKGSTVKVSRDRRGQYRIQEEKVKTVPVEAPPVANR